MAGYSDAILEVREFNLVLISENKLGFGDHICKHTAFKI